MIQQTSYLAEWCEDDVAIAERLIRAYGITMEQKHDFPTPDDLWSRIEGESSMDELKKHLSGENPEELSRYLVSHWNNTLWFGGIGTADNISMSSNPEQKVFDDFMKLVHHFGIQFHEDSNETIEEVCKFLNIDSILPPPVVSAKGLATTNGPMHYLYIQGLYLAIRIRDLTEPDHNICEYGGGFGLNMFYLHKLGRRNAYLFDLPFVNAISGYFLIKALGHDAVVLEGEKDRSQAVHIRAYWNCGKYPADFFRISANQNSFPEVDIDIVRKYFETIRHNTSSYFLSINHEQEQKILNSQNQHLSVPKVIAEFPQYMLMSRDPYPIWVDYFEELYEIEKS